MIVKLCGCPEENFDGLFDLEVDYFGFIFHPGSPRLVTQTPDIGTRKVGVFVNSDPEFILQTIEKESLDVIQFHGNESPEQVQQTGTGITKWKAIGIQTEHDFQNCAMYEGIADAFLFDTKSPQFGGTGHTFNWNILDEYTGSIPFFLGGGISIHHIDALKKIRHPKLKGIDLNSRFETKPKQKDIPLIQSFLQQLKNENC